LNVRSPWALKFTEITALAPFSTATLFTVNNLASGLHELAGPSGNRAKGELPFH